MSGHVEGARGNRKVPPTNGAADRADLGGAGAAQREGGPRGKQGFPRATEAKSREMPV